MNPVAQQILSTLASLVIVKALPILVWILSSGRPLRLKGVLGIGLLAIALGAGASRDPILRAQLVPSALALAYFTFIACVAYFVPRALRSGRVGKDSLFVGASVLCLLVPSVLTVGAFKLAFLVVGFEFTLKVYSYVVEIARADAKPTFRDALFFLLVSPVLAYPDRGRQVAPRFAIGLLRAGVGVATLAAYVAVIMSMPREQVVELLTRDQASTIFRGLGAIGLIFLTIMLVYAVHSGVASLQIGLMQIIGYQIPERYQYALLARNPNDWWRRWNTYFGSWFKRYVFVPCALLLVRRHPTRRKEVSMIVAILATFAASGLIHELMQYCVRARFSGLILVGFVAEGLLVVLWAGLARLRLRTVRSAPPHRRPWALSALRGACGWMCFVILHTVVLVVLFRALGGDA